MSQEIMREDAMRPHLTLLTPGSWSHQAEAGEVDVAEAGAGHEARIAHQRGGGHGALLLYWYSILLHLIGNFLVKTC